jgi:hypothetical protein
MVNGTFFQVNSCLLFMRCTYVPEYCRMHWLSLFKWLLKATVSRISLELFPLSVVRSVCLKFSDSLHTVFPYWIWKLRLVCVKLCVVWNLGIHVYKGTLPQACNSVDAGSFCYNSWTRGQENSGVFLTCRFDMTRWRIVYFLSYYFLFEIVTWLWVQTNLLFIR